MRIIVLDGYTLNPGDMSWEGIACLGDLTVYERTAPEEVIARSKDAEIILTNKTFLDRRTLLALPKLQFIAVLATGYNVVDIETATQQGILISNVPAYSTNSVAQMVFAHILQETNNVIGHTHACKNGVWSQNKDFCFWLTPQIELANKTIGIVGFGNIGKKVAEIALAFDMHVLAYSSKKELPNKVQSVPLKQLFMQSDFITLHCPLTTSTKHLINSQSLALMRPSAFIINTGRGPLINETDLAKALNNKQIAGAGIDVLSSEPPTDSPLLTTQNCTITPHIAWATKEARTRLLTTVKNNITAFIEKKPIHIINQ